MKGMKLNEVLKKADLPIGIFTSDRVMMTSDEYKRFMDAIGMLVPEPEIFIHMATGEGIEMFSPPIFAAYCSKNGEECLKRLGRYKKLIGPIVYKITQSDENFIINLTSVDNGELSQTFVIGEFLFLVSLIRRATKEMIKPISVMIQGKEVGHEYSKFLGSEIEISDSNEIVFSISDMQIPFITENSAMLSYFEPELVKRIDEMEIDNSVSARIRSVMSELLPAGKCTIDDASEKLGMSKRTLQRHLSEENTTFQKQLNATREVLAKHYIKTTTMSVDDIAFLLGYLETNSFLRAFNTWTGMSVGEYKRNGV
ncbi:MULTISPECIES: AraC family transcriptional regulator [Gemella]|uniref:AraC family transcriptional regulator n=2 Tax=Gemellaceae TaxID=539738 RepID=UPI00190E97C3|nr:MULTISPECIES: AraC family transcriptional regulator [Gemella]